VGSLILTLEKMPIISLVYDITGPLELHTEQKQIISEKLYR